MNTPHTMPLLPTLMLAVALSGCERQMHNMYVQPRFDPGEASPMFANGRAERPPPHGTVPAAMGQLAASSSGRKGEQAIADRHDAMTASAAPPYTQVLLQRGQSRYQIYCMPCHSPVGDGDGQVVRRGFPRPPSYHEQRLREAADRHFYDVISQGYGVMYAYGDRIGPEDRWAIVAYIRALQLSQHAPVASLPPNLRAMLDAAPEAPATTTLPPPKESR